MSAKNQIDKPLHALVQLSFDRAQSGNDPRSRGGQPAPHGLRQGLAAPGEVSRRIAGDLAENRQIAHDRGKPVTRGLDQGQAESFGLDGMINAAPARYRSRRPSSPTRSSQCSRFRLGIGAQLARDPLHVPALLADHHQADVVAPVPQLPHRLQRLAVPLRGSTVPTITKVGRNLAPSRRRKLGARGGSGHPRRRPPPSPHRRRNPPPHAFERIFERFYTDRPTQNFGQNSGLGLSISRQIVEAHGGRIKAANRTAPDDAEAVLGARFTVWLPAEP